MHVNRIADSKIERATRTALPRRSATNLASGLGHPLMPRLSARSGPALAMVRRNSSNIHWRRSMDRSR